MKKIDNVWSRIRSLEGHTFQTKTGKPFTFTVSENVLCVSRTKYNLSKGNFSKGLENVPFNGPGAVQSIVRGPAYVWAILHDARVRKDEW